MTMLLVAAVCALAYWNGANDNAKGVATLLGSGTLRYQTAIRWAAASTFAGSVTALFLAGELLRRFSGRGLVPEAVALDGAYVASVAFAAGATVLIATRVGLPISTTHALVGGMVGTGWMAVGNAVNLGALAALFLVPLLLSPLLAATVAAAGYRFAQAMRRRLGVGAGVCICVGDESVARFLPAADGAVALSGIHPPAITIAEQRECAARAHELRGGVALRRVLDAAHVATGGLVGFARGLNDTPKLAALLLVLPIGATPAILLVASAMMLGGLLHPRRVARTMSARITAMNRGQGFAASATTGVLVTLAGIWGMPVSTTHVSVGALAGIGASAGGADAHVLRGIGLSWVATLPCAALLGALAYAVLGS